MGWGKIDARAESEEKMNGHRRWRAVELRSTRGKSGRGKQSRGRRDLRGRLVEAKGKKVEVGHD